MNNTKIIILNLISKDKAISSGEIFLKLKEGSVSLITVKRCLKELLEEGFLLKLGKGRSVQYVLSSKGILLKPFDLKNYLNSEEKERGGVVSFNFDIFDYLKTDFFSKEEKEKLNSNTKIFLKNKKEGSETIHKKELERFIIELSWKSSKIEGNTYTLLDTELLLKEGLKSNKNTESETKMILNHKKAFDFIFLHQDYFKELSIKKIEEIHYLLIEDLGIKRNLRKFPVGVTGTIYKPLDNEFQIREALEKMIEVINKIEDNFIKAISVILCISYIQPFEDGNKRTSRLLGNAVLLANNLAPLSYRNVDEADFRAALLIFYEQNSLEAFKQIFIEQYIFSCNTYNLG